MKDFHRGQLMPISEILDEEEDEHEDVAAWNTDNCEDNDLVNID